MKSIKDIPNRGTQGLRWAHKTVNREEIVELIQKRLKFTKHEARVAVDAVLSTIRDSLKDGYRVTLQGFGSFRPHIKQPRSVVRFHISPGFYQELFGEKPKVPQPIDPKSEVDALIKGLLG